LGHALATLERLGIVDSLENSCTPRQLAQKHQVDPTLLECMLQMLTFRTKLFAMRNGKYRLTPRYSSSARFVFLQYVGAYSNNAAQLDQLLRSPASAGKLVDRKQHARAFDETGTWESCEIADLVVKLGLERPLDIGCGSASMLVELASRSRNFRGWGIDANPWMCKSARKRIAAARLQRRVSIFEGDCRALGSAIPLKILTDVATLTASGVVNEFFAGGPRDAINWLRTLRRVFPGRKMLIEDYYSQLGSKRRTIARAVALHDFVQAISGQGVPPSDLAAWKDIYSAADCHLVEVYKTSNAFGFIHLISF